MRDYGEMSGDELEKEIATVEEILTYGGYNKLVVDHLAMLQEYRDRLADPGG